MGEEDLLQLFGLEEEKPTPQESNVKVFHATLKPETENKPVKPVSKGIASLRSGLGWMVASCEFGVLIVLLLVVLGVIK